ncbi:MAG: TM0106 family RecB-like putative nuclease [Candidatus Cybelea sp.]
MLYDLDACEHRPWMDLFECPSKRDAVSPFLGLLWRRGLAHEEQAIAGVEALNLRTLPVQERASATLDAMKRQVPLIYGGRISSGDLLGEPDLLRLESDGKYLPGDIKSGAGEEGPQGEERRPKKRYAVQIGLYVDVLERLGLSAGRRGFVWDIHGAEVPYDLTAPKGKKSAETLWDDYQRSLLVIRQIVSGVQNPGPAYHAECKNCVWYGTCMAELKRIDDLTLLPGLGKSKREPFLPHVRTSAELAATTPERFLDDKGRSILPGIGPDSVARFHARALLKARNGSPYLRSPLTLPAQVTELFFDIETDPMRDHCYLHGFVERRGADNSTERYEGFFSMAPTAKGEHDAFADAWAYVENNRPCIIYIYSKYERTWWRALQRKYPDVCTAEDLEMLFRPSTMVDLFEIVSESTEWPTIDYSIKTLAGYLGFRWRDPHPSGAASIEWYDRYCNGDRSAKSHILEYNEDDCRAMRILTDFLRTMRPVAMH